MNDDTQARLAYLADCVDLLWPDADGPDRVVLPGTFRPRVFVPADSRRATFATLVRYTAQQPVRDRVKAVAVAAAFGIGALRPPAVRASDGADAHSNPDTKTHARSIDDVLGDLAGEPVRTSLALTRPRPNRKPVLQVFDRRGRTIAFAKVGVTPLARQLVDAEAQSLTRLAAAGLEHVRVPVVIGHAPWGDTTVLLVTALPMGRQVPIGYLTGDTLLTRAMREVSNVDAGGDMSGYLAAVRSRGEDLVTRADQWTSLIDELTAVNGLLSLRTGSWHGDWTEWNCSRPWRRSPLVVWDWERFSTPAPVGFDALHYVLNDVVSSGRGSLADATRELVTRAPELLAPWRLSARDATRVAALYVLDLGLRYATDATVQDVEEWAFPIVRTVLLENSRGATS